jgi:hypothetical protein
MAHIGASNIARCDRDDSFACTSQGIKVKLLHGCAESPFILNNATNKIMKPSGRSP